MTRIRSEAARRYKIGLRALFAGALLVVALAAIQGAAATHVGGIPQCEDGHDNDGDGLVDFGSDPGCWDWVDNEEWNAPPPPPPPPAPPPPPPSSALLLRHRHPGSRNARTARTTTVTASSTTGAIPAATTGSTTRSGTLRRRRRHLQRRRHPRLLLRHRRACRSSPTTNMARPSATGTATGRSGRGATRIPVRLSDRATSDACSQEARRS